MATWEDVVCKAKELADAAGRKVTDIAEVTKQKIKIAENERALRGALEAIGRIVYDSRRENVAVDEEVLSELIQQVDDIRITNEQLQAEIDNACGRKVCSCGATNSQGAAYCNACGKQL